MFRPLTPFLGAEVSGVDARDVPEALHERLRRAWREYGLLLFRNQDLSEDDQRRFATVFGIVAKRHKSPDGMNYVSNVAAEGRSRAGGLDFHSDHAFLDEVLPGLMLYALEAPPAGEGGETLYVSGKHALGLLPAALRARIDGLTIRHGNPDVSRCEATPVLVTGPGAFRADHPLVYPHPVTGEPLLFMCRRHADCIVGMPHDESENLMDELATCLYDERNTYRHTWRPGDVIVWDNLMLQHGRTDFDPKWPRHLRRLQIAELGSIA